MQFKLFVMFVVKPTRLTVHPGTIRGDLGLHFRRNVVHSSDSPENASREISLWFKPEETIEWDHNMAHWISELPNAPIRFESDNDPQTARVAGRAVYPVS